MGPPTAREELFLSEGGSEAAAAAVGECPTATGTASEVEMLCCTASVSETTEAAASGWGAGPAAADVAGLEDFGGGAGVIAEDASKSTAAEL